MILELSLCTFAGQYLDMGLLYSPCTAFNGSLDEKTPLFSPSLHRFSSAVTSVVLPFPLFFFLFKFLSLFLMFLVTSVLFLNQWFLNLSVHQNHLGGLLKNKSMGSTPRVSDSVVLHRGQEIAFITNSQVTLMPLVWEAQFERYSKSLLLKIYLRSRLALLTSSHMMKLLVFGPGFD